MSMKIGLMLPKLEKVPSAKENKDTTSWLAEYWNLGPEVGSDRPGSNKEYWAEMAKVWNTEEDKARRQLCANCEYFSDTPRVLKSLEAVPYNEMDATGGGRGFCSRFDFICHNLRTCQAWESNDPMCEDEGED
tara:strand:+ start:84 stop:482 length:399 start_codon:yes stop_codon:yes gene_type:complete